MMVPLPADALAAKERTVRRLVGAALLLTLVAFWPTVRSFHQVWGADPYSHGYLLAAVTVWLVWRHRHSLTAGTVGWPPALLAVAVLSLAWLVATVAGIQVVQQGTLPLLLVFWGTAVLGPRAGRTLAPIGATFLLAVPFWEALSGPLQGMTVAVSGILLGILRIPATIDGDVISVTAGSFRVEDSCAGLNYLLASLVLAVLYAHLSPTRLRTRMGIVALGAAAALVANWVRVTGLVVIGHASSMGSSIVEAHGMFGWAIYFLALPVFFFLARRLEKRDGTAPLEKRGETTRIEKGGETAGLEAAAQAPDDGQRAPARSGAVAQGTPASQLRRALLASALAVAGPVLYVVVGALPAASDESARVLFDGGESWAVVDPPEPRPFTWSPQYQGAHERWASSLSDGQDRVFVDGLAYREQSRGAELIQYGNRIADESSFVRERIVGPLGTEDRWVRQALIRTPESPLLVWYWYRVGGVETPSPLWAKVLEILAFVRRRTAAELIALSVPCAPDSCAAAHETLMAFMDAQP